MSGPRRPRVRDKARTEHVILMALRRLHAELHHRFTAADALTDLGFKPEEIGALRDLASALFLSERDIMAPEVPYVSAFEDRLLALLGDRQREPSWRVGLTIPEDLDADMIDGIASLLNSRKLRISYKTIICGQSEGRD